MAFERASLRASCSSREGRGHEEVSGTRRALPALAAGFTIAIVFGAVLSIVLTVAGPDGMGLRTGGPAAGSRSSRGC